MADSDSVAFSRLRAYHSRPCDAHPVAYFYPNSAPYTQSAAPADCQPYARRGPSGLMGESPTRSK
jgi:hypothetical protein